MALSAPIILTVTVRLKREDELIHIASEKCSMNLDTLVNQYIQNSARVHIYYHSLILRFHGGLAGIIVCHLRTNFKRSLTITANACG